MAENIFLYFQLESNVCNQVEPLANASFDSFGNSVNSAFLNVEKLGTYYCQQIKSSITNENLKDKFHSITLPFLETNPYITGLSVYLKPNIKYQNVLSYTYYYSDNHLEKNESISTETIINTIQIYPDNISKASILWNASSISKTNKNIDVSFCIPIIDTENENTVLGIIKFSIDILFFDNLLSSFNLGHQCVNILLNASGNVIVNPLPKYIPQNINLDKITSNTIEQITDSRSSYKLLAKPVTSTTIDSLGTLSCPNSLTLHYRLHNNWQILTVFYKQSLPFSLESLYSILVPVNILALVLFFMILMYIVNWALKDLNTISSTMRGWNKYDIHEWKLPKIEKKDEMSMLVEAFDQLYSNMQHTQYQLTDALVKNDKLMSNELKLEDRIRQAVDEETLNLATRNRLLDIAVANITELNELGKSISSSLQLDKICFSIYDKLIQLIPINFFGILIYDKTTNVLNCNYGVLNGELSEPFSISNGEKNNIATKCWEKNEPIIINNFEVEVINHLLVNSYNPLSINMASQYYAPISDNNDIVGVFTIQSIYKGIFKEFNMDILSILHTYLNVSIKNILSFEELQASVKKLNTAQTKLVLSEKMASMGQLAAGISHEIKNPLNFVINFSELTHILIQDLKTELNAYKSNNNADESDKFSEIEDMVENMQLNVERIVEHSRRADKIVKGMLQLSRGKTGEFVSANINDIITEYTKLAYHGLRATNPMFYVNIVYDLDETLGKVDVVPHNISRVIINIVANACVATFDKHKDMSSEDSRPEVKISTKNIENQFEIIVWDNGIGISEENKNKIFNPFFTTKPAGEGTGLGLSISYDIVVAEHNGEIVFDTSENVFTEFRVILPKKHSI